LVFKNYFPTAKEEIEKWDEEFNYIPFYSKINFKHKYF